MSGTATETPAPQAQTQARPKDWDGRSRTGIGILIFFYLFRFLGPRFAYALLYPVCLYQLVFNQRHGRASRDYLRRRFPGLRGPALWWKNYRHFLSFGRVLIDRGFAFLGMLGQVRLDRDGQESFAQALAMGKGVILVSAHLGNWELAAYCLGEFQRDGRRVMVNAVMFKGESEKVEKQLKRASGDPPFRVISSNDSLQASIECMNALKRGEVVAIHGDRVLGAEGIEVPFMGAPARFPIGPLVLAANTGAPVVFTFANRVGMRHYALLARGPYLFQFESRALRQENLRQWAGIYAGLLEELVGRYPLQWHNFFLFWAAGQQVQPKK